MSERIKVIRIVDRYLEHGRIFVFNNNGETELFLGSADWMNRNIYRRIEVCFPVYHESMKAELLQMLNYQLHDTQQAVTIDTSLRNVAVDVSESAMTQSQHQISTLFNAGN